MKLTLEGIKEKSVWEEKSYVLPGFDYEAVKENTAKNPNWIHFGAGNIFRAFLANVNQNNLNEGVADTGIVVAEGFDYEIIEKMYVPHDNLSLLVTLKSTGEVGKTVVASVMEALPVDPTNKSAWGRLEEIFQNPSLQMVSFTITEKGYNLQDNKGEYYPAVAGDFEAGPAAAGSYIGKLVALVYGRYLKGKLPLALVSMDNCSHNGTRLHDAVLAYAENWEKRGLVEQGFVAYLEDPKSISFPWSMIDKITPRPDKNVKEMLRGEGFEDVDDIITSKNTYVAPFVNAEEPQYLVIEDKFPNGRPVLKDKGVIFSDRETVDKVEKMKVCTCLNPLHTAMSIYGCLLGYELISEEMKDPSLKALVEKVGYVEGLPVVVHPGIIEPKNFIDEVIQVRFPNPFMPDTPQRIATDTSQKLSIRFGETIKAYDRSADLDVKDLKVIPLVLAGWCRYLMGVDDEGKEMELSSDPMLGEVKPHLEGIRLGDAGPFSAQLKPILSDEKIFGVNLYEVGLGEVVEGYFAELVASKGAVRKTLEKYVG
ncbi:mannitol dehydrogenase family protein [Anaerotalea alkaliphila]|uniref:Mannitol dehydrogenase family protein n=1 Tax=Anaerotalea alkaliphila TaxID=2662126 RepID=A0A7X5HXK5_9FIRM|nr:mannitol dehydrogenase family protein [Anaerotalea alkaliphila]NDL68470.1 mannitol dehydrogenase family protein [Anaerotalea alkaliphila]